MNIKEIAKQCILANSRWHWPRFRKMHVSNELFISKNLPKKGPFIGWKAVHMHESTDSAKTYMHDHRNAWSTSSYRLVIIKVLIPADAERVSAKGKCRASSIVPLEVFNFATGEHSCYLRSNEHRVFTPAVHFRDGYFEYKLNKEKKSSTFDSDKSEMCSRGIHFYMTKKEAKGFPYL